MKKLVTLIVSFMLMFTMAFPVGATSSDVVTPVNEARKGVLQINLDYVDQSGSALRIQGGSGFLIGATSGAEYMITNAHVVRMTGDTAAAVSEMIGSEVANNNSNLHLNVVVKADLTIGATIVNYSDELDFAILKLEQPIYDRAPLTINAGDNNAVETQSVYALGFPAAVEHFQDTQYYTTDDVNVTNGIVSKRITLNNMSYIQHSAKVAEGNSGGPLVNQNGEVIGLNQGIMSNGEFIFDENYYYSIEISEVTQVLDMLGVQYSSAELEPVPEPEPNPNPEPGPQPESVNRSSLDAAITAANSVDLEKYTEESVAVFKEAKAKADALSTSSTATQDEVNAAASALTKAQGDLVEAKTGPNMVMILIIVAAMLAVVIVVIVIVVTLSNKKKEKATRTAGFAGPTGDLMNSGQKSAGSAGAVVQHVPERSGHGGYVSDGAGVTTVLNAGSGETSVLGGVQIHATLLRKKNNESIQINKQLFRIGKERAKVDYCVPDNNSISRIHAHIISKGGVFFIIDQNSTNFTFVNGNKISPNQETKLNNGDKIKLSDEEFEFRV